MNDYKTEIIKYIEKLNGDHLRIVLAFVKRLAGNL